MLLKQRLLRDLLRGEELRPLVQQVICPVHNKLFTGEISFWDLQCLGNINGK